MLLYLVYIYLIDVDECTLATDICNVHSDCVNTNGSYDCNCTTGYIIESDKRTCSGKFIFKFEVKPKLSRSSDIFNNL